MKEKWVQICKIQGFENVRDCYWLSNSDEDIIVNRNTGKKRKIRFHRDGYPIVNLCTKDKKKKMCKIYILKARAFIYTPNPLGADQVRHLDDCKTNNSLTNLAFGTQSDNAQDSIRNGRFNYEVAIKGCAMGASKGGTISGKKNGVINGKKNGTIRAKKTSKPVRCLETGIIYPNSYEASRQLVIERNSIRNCCHGKQQTAGGFHFEFVNKEVK